jgi:hypothetical protein
MGLIFGDPAGFKSFDATENTAVVKALLADLIERGLRPDIARPAAPAMREHQTPRSE